MNLQIYVIRVNIYKALNPEKTNVTVGYIYRYPHMNLDEFSDYYLNILLNKLSNETESVFLLGDSNIGLLKHDQLPSTNGLLDSLSSDLIIPQIIQPTRIRKNSKTLFDNTYSNVISPNSILSNLTATISDHLT